MSHQKHYSQNCHCVSLFRISQSVFFLQFTEREAFGSKIRAFLASSSKRLTLEKSFPPIMFSFAFFSVPSMSQLNWVQVKRIDMMKNSTHKYNNVLQYEITQPQARPRAPMHAIGERECRR
eukprot:c17389_g1_i1 orf=212-574(+)